MSLLLAPLSGKHVWAQSMSEVSAFLDGTLWQDWHQTPVAGDASARSYRRLTSPNGESVILMIAPPEAGEDLGPFFDIADHLAGIGLCPPSILKSDQAAGLAIIGDLGPRHFADWIAAGDADELTLYQAAADCIQKIGASPAPAGLKTMTPEVGADMVGLYSEWFAPSAEGSKIAIAMKAALERLAPHPYTLSLRDFHAENLIWRPEKDGTDRVGLLDFQDAFMAHPFYDLVSLLRDARRDVSDRTVDALTKDVDMAAFSTISVQRNLRILGIFARLVQRDKKPKYQPLIPRVINHLRRDLAHPDLHDLSELILPDLTI
jgi:aminoglycoside/choline kinase family phosphotransferase